MSSRSGPARAAAGVRVWLAGASAGRMSLRTTQLAQYGARVRGPTLDRLDLQVEVPALTSAELLAAARGDPSAVVRERVLAARERQRPVHRALRVARTIADLAATSGSPRRAWPRRCGRGVGVRGRGGVARALKITRIAYVGWSMRILAMGWGIHAYLPLKPATEGQHQGGVAMRHPPSRYHHFGAARSNVAPALLAMFLLVPPRPSAAIQLRWSGGATDLSFSQNTRAVLVAETDSAETILPAQWRLLWVADSAGIQLVAPDSLEACLSDTAKVSSFDLPITRADSAANIITARFCAENASAANAHYVFDLVGSSQGRFKVVALDPNDPDSAQVLESNEVTWNGGTEGDFPTVILRATRSHPSTQLHVEAVGAGLAAAQRVAITAPDGSWRVPLSVTGQSATSLTAVAQVAADLPASLLEIGGVSSVAVATLDADTASLLSVRPACVNYMKEIDITGQTDIQPKDFAITTSRDSFHVYYIRHDMKLSTDQTEKNIGHQRSRDLNTWIVADKAALQVRPDRWDNFHVWAPTIVKKSDDPTYYMSWSHKWAA